MNKLLNKTIIPLAVLTGAYACGEDSPKDGNSAGGSGGEYTTSVGGTGGDGIGGFGDVGGATGVGGVEGVGGAVGVGGINNVGGSGGAGGADCIENNPGSGFDGAATSYYSVGGSTVEEASSDIFDPESGKGFKDEKTGEIYAAQASCDVNYTYNYEGNQYTKTVLPTPGAEEREVCCYDLWVSDCDAPYEATVTMPRWGGCDPCWDKFLEGLTKHEQGHVDLCKAESEKLEDVIKGATASECADTCEAALTAATTALEKAVEELATANHSEFEQKNDDYDSQTNHGETQGAVLDPNCDE